MGNIGYKNEIIITDVWEREGGREGMVGQVTRFSLWGLRENHQEHNGCG